jgi:alkanesulfonate monooxygenase SsuD/methylene tetrahydromethanopterin reductase-like flavin-dependent oxidoreductase (luciferase family)
MKFGVFDHMDDSGRDPGQQFEERLKLIEIYDRSAFHAYHLAEHHGTPLGLAPSPNLFLAAAIQRSRRLRLGAMVLLLPLYPPLRLIQEIAILDHMSGGRLELGVGRGVSPIEVAFFGLDPAASAEQFAEALDVILAGFRGGELSYDGKFYSFSRVPMILTPRQKPHPPLWYGVNRAESIARVAGQGMNIMMNGPAGRVRELTDGFRSEWSRLGRAAMDLPFLALSRHVVVADSRAEAEAIATRAYRPWRRHIEKLWKERDVPFPLALPDEFGPLAEAGLGIAGTPEQVAATIAGQADTAGFSYFCARMCFGDMTFEEASRSAELFTGKVMPSIGSIT